MKLALDHHYSTAIATQLRERGHDVVAAIEQGWEAESDEALLVLCETAGRALLTTNVSDFTVISLRWAVEGRGHAGLIFTSDASMPRGRDTIGRYLDVLDELLGSDAGADGFADRAHWL